MNFSPGDISVYEPTLAGPAYNQSKTAGSLGLGFAVGVLCDSPMDIAAPTMGLDLIVDEDLEDITLSTSSSGDAPVFASPPLLGTRRSPHRPAASPWAEHAPMRTPSPSLRARAWAPPTLTIIPTSLLAVPAQPTPSMRPTPLPPLPTSAGVSEGLNLLCEGDDDDDEHTTPYLPTSAGVSEGLNLLCEGVDDDDEYAFGLGMDGLPGFDDDSRIAIIQGLRSPAAPRFTAAAAAPPMLAGLGFDHLRRVGCGCDDSDDSRITVVEMPARPSMARPSMVRPSMRPRLTRDAASIDNDNVSTPASSSEHSPSASPAPTGAYAAPVFHVAPTTTNKNTTTRVASPVQRASVGLGLFDVDGVPMETAGSITLERCASRRPAHPITNASSGSPSSPFWETYAEDEVRALQMRRKLLSRLPIIEEVVHETPRST